MTSRMTACLRAFMFSEYTKPLTDYACECINILLGDRRERMPIAAPDKKTAPATGRQAATGEPATRVAVAGATGYAGQELVRLLARHPSVRLTAAMSSGATSAPRPLPALARIWDQAVTPLDIDQLSSSADIVFLALPETASAEVAPRLLERGTRVIDLSGAFRIREAADRQRWYPATATLPQGTVYGLPERDAAAIRDARLVSCPGCYPTAALLALEPLADAALIEGTVIVDAKSGISGAGKAPSDRTHFSENHGSVSAYGVFSHRHNAEVAKALEDAYRDAAFVRLTGAALPEIKHVAHTNFCDIGWKVDEERHRLALIVVLDNLVKGAAGQAVQNLNIVLGLDERTG